MKALAIYIDNINRFRKIFNEPLISTDPNKLSAQDIALLKIRIESDLSPENLHCDGEISHADAMKKKNFLKAAEKELCDL